MTTIDFRANFLSCFLQKSSKFKIPFVLNSAKGARVIGLVACLMAGNFCGMQSARAEEAGSKMTQEEQTSLVIVTTESANESLLPIQKKCVNTNKSKLTITTVTSSMEEKENPFRLSSPANPFNKISARKVAQVPVLINLQAERKQVVAVPKVEVVQLAEKVASQTSNESHASLDMFTMLTAAAEETTGVKCKESICDYIQQKAKVSLPMPVAENLIVNEHVSVTELPTPPAIVADQKASMPMLLVSDQPDDDEETEPVQLALRQVQPEVESVQPLAPELANEISGDTYEYISSSTDTISCHDLLFGTPSIDNKIANQLNVDVRPRRRVKRGEVETNELYDTAGKGNKLPENLAIAKHGKYSESPQVGAGCSRYQSRNLALWAAPKFHHQPLYFEQPNLERYGHYVHGQCVQSAISAAHFFGSISILPYKIGANYPSSCDYTLGRYRPGNCNPRRRVIPEVSMKGLFNQGLFVTGAFFALP